MPPRAKRPCRHRGCAAVTNDVSGYCEIHRQQHIGDGWRNHQSGKSRQQRGYGRPWEIIRASFVPEFSCATNIFARTVDVTASPPKPPA